MTDSMMIVGMVNGSNSPTGEEGVSESFGTVGSAPPGCSYNH
jgi:hypothetical protein